MSRILILCLAIMSPSVALAQSSPEGRAAAWVLAEIERTVLAPVRPGMGDAPSKQLALSSSTGETWLVDSVGITDTANALVTAAQLLPYAASVFSGVSNGATLPADMSGRIWTHVARSLRERGEAEFALRNRYQAWILLRTAQLADGMSAASHFAARSGRSIAGLARDLVCGIGDAGNYVRRALER